MIFEIYHMNNNKIIRLKNCVYLSNNVFKYIFESNNFDFHLKNLKNHQ